MIDLSFLKRNAQTQRTLSKTMVKSGNDYILTETVEYTIPKKEVDYLKEQANKIELEVNKQKNTFTELEKGAPFDIQ